MSETLLAFIFQVTPESLFYVQWECAPTGFPILGTPGLLLINSTCETTVPVVRSSNGRDLPLPEGRVGEQL